MSDIDCWETVPLPSVIADIVDNRGRTAPTAPTGIPLIATNCIKEENLYPTFENIRYVSQDTHKNWFRGHPLPGDVILVNKGTPGRVCQVPDPVNFCIAQDMVALRPNTELVEPDYLLAAMRSKDFKDQVEGLHVGTLIPHLKKQDLPNLRIPLPPKPMQRAIGGLYCDLSRQIDLNRRMNRTLEAMASALFKSWFVDFDPVVAKAEGRQPYGMNAETAALFPAAFQDSELGPIPHGWHTRPLSSLANFENGLALQKYRPEGLDFLPVIKIRELRQGSSDSQSEKASPNIKPSCVVADRDILFSWSGSLLVDVWCGGPGALNQHLFKVTSDAYPKWFYLHWIYHHLPDFQDIASGKATTMGHIQRHHLDSALTVVPDTAVLERANRLSEPLLDMVIQNRLENRALAAIRDTLLPKLLSGEIRRKTAEREVERAIAG